MHTIVLDDFGLFLGKKHERFVVKKSGKAVAEFPAREVDRIIISSSGVSVSSSALYLAVTNRIPVAFTYSSGTPFGFLTPTLGHGTVLTRRAQYTEAESPVATTLAVGFVRGKMSNQRNLLKMWAKNRTRRNPTLSENLFGLAEEVQRLTVELEPLTGPLTSDMRQAIMNIEGRAASSYWTGVAEILPKDLNFVGRTTRGAKDIFNMMLNYGYGILYSEVWSAVTTAGLDPFAGFLHVDRPGRPSLVLDLIEEFRQQAVDRTLIAMVQRWNLRPEEMADNGELSKTVRQKIAEAVVKRLGERVTFGNSSTVLKNAIVRQAWSVAKVLRREQTRYTPFVLRW
ncbi:MAG: CRISPR-associated endonuclease Cas1 [Candidatus Thorarchaeota archaeon]